MCEFKYGTNRIYENRKPMPKYSFNHEIGNVRCKVFDHCNRRSNHVLNRNSTIAPMALDGNPQYDHCVITSKSKTIVRKPTGEYTRGRKLIRNNHRDLICPYSMLTYKNTCSTPTYKDAEAAPLRLPTSNTTHNKQLENNHNMNYIENSYHDDHTSKDDREPIKVEQWTDAYIKEREEDAIEQHYAEPNDDENLEHVFSTVIEKEIRNWNNHNPSKMTKSTNDDADETMDITYN